MTAADLTGEWDGIFNYPHGYPPSAFSSQLRQSGVALTGETIERSDGRGRGKTLHAWIEGSCAGGSVRFVKSYDDPERAGYTVIYSGSANGDVTEINGIWDIPGQWSGTFIMVRRGGKLEEVASCLAETVD